MGLDEKEMRDLALERVRREQPMLLVGSPMCSAFSTWQRINNNIRDQVTVAAELKRAVMHLEFCVSLNREQLKNGRYFLHGHSAHASSWQTDIMEKFMREPGVMWVTCDQCVYGCEVDNSPVKNPTSFLTDAPELGRELSARCFGRAGLVQPTRGRRAHAMSRQDGSSYCHVPLQAAPSYPCPIQAAAEV